MAVKFNHSHSVGAHYNKDDVAAFDEEIEKDLIERKIATAVKAPAEKKAAA